MLLEWPILDLIVISCIGINHYGHSCSFRSLSFPFLSDKDEKKNWEQFAMST